ncbi:MAG: carbamoyl phosphate synthase large subunit [Candidatus Omnitrophica bacterium 4484_49]|nr:MAG: carbamoyl phosphate synthase large subunit [Candidatus Omnitrophica bacterium 4484_49]
MPKRTDIRKILIIGSGPIVIGQACEFDYSGTQACKALRQEGFEIVLLNSNPATIMTDPEFADRTYIEPITVEVLDRILEREKPDAILPTLGGQTALNVAVKAHDEGVLKRHKVKLIGANEEAIRKAEDRELFKKAMEKIGLEVPRSDKAYTLKEARAIVERLGFPVIIRPSFTLGGTGGGIAYNWEEFDEIAQRGLSLSMINEILIEESVIGWKEFELEVMRDLKDNVVIICSIENFDPMGIHTGDSITVAPAQTLTDKEYQRMRDAAIACIREIGVETGGSNIQFAVNPEDGRMVIIEMNPRVSRSSALASKATGFPIAKIAAKLAVGYTLDEIPNDITKKTPASFEPVIDYCVVKIPRWAFEKFPQADSTLTTQMKSVGEVMAIGRTFKEALQKGLRSLEIGRSGLGYDGKETERSVSDEELRKKLIIPNGDRIFYIKEALRRGMDIDEIYELTRVDKWFLAQINQIVIFAEELRQKYSYNLFSQKGEGPPYEVLYKAKQYGFSDRQLAHILGKDEDEIRRWREDKNLQCVYKLVDTCAAEFEAYTPYYYSTYERENEARHTKKKKIAILGGGPNRIGQGIEFDYCCVHAVFALRELGYETIMINSNPETVSTDYDTADKLYFEPLTKEDVLNIIHQERPEGIIVQFGGQTPLNLSVPLREAGVNILGTSADSIDRAEDRRRFKQLLEKLDIHQPPNGTATNLEEAKRIAHEIGYPVLLRPSYVLGGRAMEIVYDDEDLERFMKYAVQASEEHPVLIDKYLEDSIEVDVDMIADGRIQIIGGVMEHIEEAGVHSGDSAMVLPPYSLPDEIVDKIKQYTIAMARELNIVGLMNVQYAVKEDTIYVLEVNPRASRTIPFVSKAIGVPLAKLAAKIMAGERLKTLGFTKEVDPGYIAVKESVFPFNRFPGVDIILGPEMKSTGEVMGIDTDFGKAYLKSQIAAGQNLPTQGQVFVSVKNKDKRKIVFIAKRLKDLGFSLVATSGTAKVLKKHGVSVRTIYKIQEGRPNVLDLMKNREIQLIINTPSGKVSREHEVKIRSHAVQYGIPIVTTIPGAQATVNALESLLGEQFSVKSLQEYHREMKGVDYARVTRGRNDSA